MFCRKTRSLRMLRSMNVTHMPSIIIHALWIHPRHAYMACEHRCIHDPSSRHALRMHAYILHSWSMHTYYIRFLHAYMHGLHRAHIKIHPCTHTFKFHPCRHQDPPMHTCLHTSSIPSMDIHSWSHPSTHAYMHSWTASMRTTYTHSWSIHAHIHN
jgi:hypothetical protein